ncbi:MAG: hypothetical protein IPH61_01645 [Bacteroidetes bacterium]|nr:hypothetical protein [Bacteroidota bacterium]
MRLLINTASTHKGGGVQVANSLIEEFRNFPENEYHIVLGIMLQSLIKKETFNDNFYFYSIGARPASSIQSMRNAKRFLNTLIDSINPDVVLTTSGPSYWKTKKPHVMGFNLGHFVYSDSPFYKSISLIQKVKWNIKFLSINYFYKRDADAVVVQTDDVKNRLQIKWPEKKIYTVSNTVNEIYINPLLLEKNYHPEEPMNLDCSLYLHGISIKI